MTGLASSARGAPRSARAVMASRDPLADSVDFFPTPPWGARCGAELITRLDPAARTVWEPAAGAGHMAHGLRDYFEVQESDAYDYGRGTPLIDFADPRAACRPADWIVTNPPFALIESFIRLGWRRAGRGLALLMRLAVLEGQARHQLMHVDVPLSVVAPFAERLPMHKGRWEPDGVTATAYAWFLWRKPERRGLARSAPAQLWPIAPGARLRLTRPSDAAFAVADQ